ncbi:MAG: SMP-30/gluconolactonase/LRE family protein [Rubrobacter sp.]
MIFAENLSVPEGPVVLPNGSWLVVEMGPDRGCVTRLREDGGIERVITRTGRPNGLAVDAYGAIWVAESQEPSLIRLSMSGEAEVILTGCDGEPFLFPNDLCFGPDGALYMTDSGVRFEDWAPEGRVRADYARAPIDGRVYKMDPETRAIEKLDAGIRFANGVAFGPDDDLYVNETISGMVYRYPWEAGETLGDREEFGTVTYQESGAFPIGPDGMAYGADGNLYVTVYGQGDVTVLSPDGAVVERIETAGRLPTNVAFGPSGERKIYVTETDLGQVEVFEVGTEGLRLYS